MKSRIFSLSLFFCFLKKDLAQKWNHSYQVLTVLLVFKQSVLWLTTDSKSILEPWSGHMPFIGRAGCPQDQGKAPAGLSWAVLTQMRRFHHRFHLSLTTSEAMQFVTFQRNWRSVRDPLLNLAFFLQNLFYMTTDKQTKPHAHKFVCFRICKDYIADTRFFLKTGIFFFLCIMPMKWKSTFLASTIEVFFPRSPPPSAKRGDLRARLLYLSMSTTVLGWGGCCREEERGSHVVWRWFIGLCRPLN